MEYAPESVLSTTLRFITEHVAVFPNDASLLPPADDPCSLVAVAPKYGLVFAGFGTSFKVYQAQSLLGECEKKDVATVNTGSPITHLVSSCDGLTLMAVILQGDVPHALFYECRNFVPGCGNQTPFASVALGQGSRVRVMGIAWNPTDPSSVAVATSPGSLSILTLKDNAIDNKTVELKACAVGWSPKGKQLTVGLADGSLALFKPDLTPVRNIVRPPMEELGAVLSITWFTSTEFFIGYKQEAEEGGHVMMFVSAPKGKEPKFVLYEFLCNDNQGSRPPMFYPIFISEWSVLCVLSSRAVQLGVLGKPASGEEAWCEYEMEEGSGAGLHNISVTKETFALGMAVDFTSLKSFTHKDGSTSGPCPVMYALSTGGELNIFHFANAVSGAPRLTKLAEALPNVGHRTADQYPGFKSYATLPSAGGATPALSAGAAQGTSPAPKFGSIGGTGPAPSPFKSMAQTSNIGASPFQQTTSSTPNNLFKLPQSTSSSIFGTAGSSNMFGTAQQQVPQGVIAPSASTTTNSLPTTFTGTLSQQFRASVPNTIVQPDKPAPMGILQPQVNKTVPAQVVNLPGSLPKADSTVGSISQGKPALAPMSSTPLKSKSPTPVMPKTLDAQVSLNVQSPSHKLDLGKSKEPDLRPAIGAIQDNFEKELADHFNKQSIVEIGKKEDMGEIRSSLTEQRIWIDQMSTTSADQKTEVTQLHSKVLEGFTLLEEAEGQLQKRKNPRHMMSLQSRPLDPQSRRMLEEIRSRYQYLQSQLTEVITKLHLDWAEFLSTSSSKKKKDLPASETLYHALLKCHSYRISLEKQVDLLCEKVKTLQLHSLSGSLQGTYKEDDEILAKLEKSMKDTSLSSTVRISPVKFLPQEKQEKLQRLLAQRKSVPIRKYASTPRVNLAELQNNSSLNESSDHVNSSLFVNHSSSTPALDFSSFGPQTFSTPNHKNSVSVNSTIASPAKESTDGRSESTKSGFHTGGTPSLATSSPSINLGKPQYEDITPPQTPSVKPEGAKSSNPLSALTSFVLKVPKTTPVETKPSSTISFSFNGASSDPAKAASSAGPPPSAGFSFIGANSSTSLASVASGSSLSLPTTSTNATGSANAGSNTSFGASFSFKPPVTSNNLFSNMSAPSASSLPSIASTTTTLSFSTPSSSLTTTSGSLFSNTSLGTGIGSLPIATQITTSLSSTVLTAGSSKPVASSAVAALSSTTNTAVSIGSSFTVSSGASGSIFGNSTASGSSIFSEGSTGSSMFGGQASSSKIAFGATLSTTASLAAGSSTTLSTAAASDEKSSGKEATGSLLSSPGITVSTTPQAGVVGGGATSSSTSLFSSAGSLFGGNSSVTIKAILSSSTATSSSPISGGSIFSQSNSLSRTSLFTPPSTVSGGNLPTITSGSIFASAASSPTQAASSPTQAALSPTQAASSPTQAASSFGSPTPPSTTTSTSGSIFSSAGSSGALFSSPASTSASSGNMFGTAISSPSSGTLFNLSSTSSSVSKTTPVSSTPGGMFGVSTTSTTSPFGSPAVSAAVAGGTAGTSTGASVFAIAATTAGSLFGTPTTTTPGSGTGLVTTSSGGVFGTSSTPASSGSLLGSPTSQPSTFGTSAFGALTTSSTGSAFSTLTSSGFSLTVTTTTATGSVFGQTQTSLFGQTPQSPTSGSVFGAQTTTSGSLFGAQPTSTSSSVFGSQPTSTSGSVFGSQPTSTSGSVFGSQPSSTSGSVFGGQPTSSSASVFGSQPTSSSGSVFGSQPTSTTGSVFGSPTSTSSIFGNSGQGSSGFGSSGSQSGSIFGGASSTIGSAFGQPITSSGFGNGTSGSVFGQTSTQGSSPFNASSTENSSSSVFGSGFGSGGGLFSGLGGKPSQENANKNVFGSMNFNDAKPQSGLFSGGASQTSTFGGGMTFGGSAGTGSGGTFSSPVSQTAQSGFGTTTPQKSAFGGGGSTFGGGASFGASPVFGSPPKFGNSATFGGNATFGSPVSSSTAAATGSASPSVGFGSFGAGGSTFGAVAGSTSSPSGFGSFASQGSAASFSSLAQQTQAPSAFGGGGGTFGSSSSFSSWRS